MKAVHLTSCWVNVVGLSVYFCLMWCNSTRVLVLVDMVLAGAMVLVDMVWVEATVLEDMVLAVA